MLTPVTNMHCYLHTVCKLISCDGGISTGDRLCEDGVENYRVRPAIKT